MPILTWCPFAPSSPAYISAFLSALAKWFTTLRGKAMWSRGQEIGKRATRDNKDINFPLPHILCLELELVSGVSFKFHALRENFSKKHL
jgi:hypothetical protein